MADMNQSGLRSVKQMWRDVKGRHPWAMPCLDRLVGRPGGLESALGAWLAADQSGARQVLAQRRAFSQHHRRLNAEDGAASG